MRDSRCLLYTSLSVVAIAPGVSFAAELLLLIPAVQMIAGQPSPVFPRRIADYALPTPHLAALVQRAVPVLKYLEKVIHPRWPTPHEATKRLVGTVVAILSASLVFIPIPLSNAVSYTHLDVYKRQATTMLSLRRNCSAEHHDC